MKKHWLLLCCLLMALNFGAQAQKKKDKDKKVKLGIKAGLNRSSVAFKDNGGVDLATTAKAALNTGVYARFFLAKGRVVIQPELLYSREGFVYDSTLVENNATTQEDVRTKLSFMSVPLNVTIRPTKHFSFQLGPSFGYLLDAAQKSDNISQESITSLMNRAEMALNFGVGFDVLKILNINLRYKHGLTQLNKGVIDSIKANPLEAVDLVNRMFQVSVGLNLFKRNNDFLKADASTKFGHFKEKRTLLKKQY
jgi:hypothetical protein